MSYRDTYDFWMTDDYFDEDTKKELAAIADDEAEIEDRFYRDLVFGTGGLRGVIGAGTKIGTSTPSARLHRVLQTSL